MLQGIGLKISIAAALVLAGGVYVALGKNNPEFSQQDRTRNQATLDAAEVAAAQALPGRKEGSAGRPIASKTDFSAPVGRPLAAKSPGDDEDPEGPGTRVNSGVNRVAPTAVANEIDSAERDLLRLAYQQALIEDPQLAAEILREINAEESGTKNYDDYRELDEDTYSADDQLAENQEPLKDEDFPWCQNRPPLTPETFRCPCPSDPGYRSYWRKHMDPSIAEAAGC